MLRFLAPGTSALAAIAFSGCAIPIESARLDHPVTAKGEGLAIEATNVGFDLAVAMHGTDENTVFVAELELHNRRNTSLVVSLERITLGVDRGAAQAVSAKTLHPVAAGVGSLPDTIGVFKIALPVSLAPGQHQKVWVAFKNVGVANDHVTYGLTIHVPVDGSEPLLVKLSDAAEAGPRWSLNKQRPSMSLGFLLFGLEGGQGDTFGGGGPGFSFAGNLPWFDWSTRFTVSPLIISEGEKTGGGVWNRWQFAFPLPLIRGRSWSVAPTIGVDLAHISFDSDVPAADPTSTMALGYNVGLSLLIDMEQAYLGSFPLEPRRSVEGRTLTFTVGGMQTWGLEPGNASSQAGMFAFFGWGFL